MIVMHPAPWPAVMLLACIASLTASCVHGFSNFIQVLKRLQHLCPDYLPNEVVTHLQSTSKAHAKVLQSPIGLCTSCAVWSIG